MDSPKFFCIKHDEPVKSPKSFIRYYTNITKISPNGRNDKDLGLFTGSSCLIQKFFWRIHYLPTGFLKKRIFWIF